MSNLSVFNAARELNLGEVTGLKGNWLNGAYDPWVNYLSGKITYEEYQAMDVRDGYDLADPYHLPNATAETIDWNAIDSTPYLGRNYIATLAAEYYATGDTDYAKAFFDFFTLFTETHPDQVEWIYSGRYGGTVLGVAELTENFFVGLTMIANGLGKDGATYEDWKANSLNGNTDLITEADVDFLEPGQLEAIVELFIEHYVEPMVRTYVETPNIVVNQRIHGIFAAKKLSTVFPEQFAEYQELIDQGVSDVLRQSVRPDGGFIEASINYNIGSAEFIHEASLLAPDEEWTQPYLEAYENFQYLAQALLSPFGTLPQIGNNHWLSTDGDEVLALAQESIALPYSGYYVQRSGYDEDADYLFFYNMVPSRGHVTVGGNSIQVAAHGEQLLISGGPTSYNNGGTDAQNAYLSETSSWKTNTILVDGYSQRKTSADPNADPEIVQERWLDSDHFDYVEGTFDGEYVQNTTAAYADVGGNLPDEDISHQRKVIYLEDAGIWIVVDTMQASEVHEFTQVWKFAQTFGPDDLVLDADGNTITVAKDASDTDVNLALHQFGTDIDYTSHYADGEYGYVATDVFGAPEAGLDLHATFTPAEGETDVTVITVISPFVGKGADTEAISYVDTTSDGIAGVEIDLGNGRIVSVAAATDLTVLSAGGKSVENADLLVVDSNDGAPVTLVTGDREITEASYQESADGIELIEVPEGFSWETDEDGVLSATLLPHDEADDIDGGADDTDDDTANGNTPGDGSSYDNKVNGDSAHDMITGNAGDELLHGGGGINRLVGGGGEDHFVMKADGGLDIVYDFTAGEDKIALIGMSYEDVSIETYRGNDTLIRYGNDRLILRDTDANDLSISDFQSLTENDLI